MIYNILQICFMWGLGCSGYVVYKCIYELLDIFYRWYSEKKGSKYEEDSVGCWSYVIVSLYIAFCTAKGLGYIDTVVYVEENTNIYHLSKYCDTAKHRTIECFLFQVDKEDYSVCRECAEWEELKSEYYEN